MPSETHLQMKNLDPTLDQTHIGSLQRIMGPTLRDDIPHFIWYVFRGRNLSEARRVRGDGTGC